jgi:xylan 1,4-beta-xylosidase
MPQQELPTIQVTVDAGKWLGEMAHNWTYIGYDEINYTYTPEGRELLAKFMAMQEQPYYVRAHHLLCTGNCHGFYKWGSTNAYLEDDAGNPVYSWTFVDMIFDAILQYHCKPFVEIGFMPQDLVDPRYYDITKDNARMDVYRTSGWKYPPKDHRKWYDLVYNLVSHCLDRYGLDEVKTWYWELWNEPDIQSYWLSSIEEFNTLYDHTAAAVKAACPMARVGGPGTTNPVYGRPSAEYLDKFLEHCSGGANACTGESGAPLDFISFHVKGGGFRSDPKHRPATPPSVKKMVTDLRTGYEIISKHPGCKDIECVLSEIDPDGWAAGGAWDNANLNFRNTEYYASFVAASFDKVSAFAREKTWDLRLLTWAFMFVGERCFEGTRAFSTQGIDKAILNLFRMYAKLGRQQVSLQSTGAKDPLAYADICGRGETPDIAGFATLNGDKSLHVLLYNHHDDWNVSSEYAIDLAISNLPFSGETATLTHYRIDQTHSNTYAEWLRQGKPMYPTPGQREAIKGRDGLETIGPPQPVQVRDGQVRLGFRLPVHGISLLALSQAR